MLDKLERWYELLSMGGKGTKQQVKQEIEQQKELQKKEMRGGRRMSKAIMISINPKWVAKILNGEKTIEIRKTMPKCNLPVDVYIYCTKKREKSIVDRSVWFGYKDGETLLGNCRTPQKLLDYIHLGNKGYAWQIDDLVIFDEPKELSEYGMPKAPQSWCYVEVEE